MSDKIVLTIYRIRSIGEWILTLDLGVNLDASVFPSKSLDIENYGAQRDGHGI